MKKKITFLLLMIFATANIYSQNYTISFDASGTTNTLDSVRIINLTHPDTAIWHNGDIFQLQLNNAINEIETNKENLHIFPNPMQGQADILFNVKQAGIASIKIYEVTGKEIIHSDENLSQGNHQFQLSGLKQGAYFINIRGNGYFYRSKLISYNSFSNDINLKYNGVIQETNTNIYKTTNSSINFNFVSGDMLQFTGYAANLTDVFTYSPTSDITVTFNFIASIPSVTTNVATSITTNSAISGGNVTSDGGEIVTERGICYATTTNPTIAVNIVAAGSGTGIFTANLSGLSPNTTYYIRAYATNSLGTNYGNEVVFTTIPASLPILTTTSISTISCNTAISGGNISYDGGDLVTVRGVCWSTSPNPSIALSTKTINGANTGSFTSDINGLTAGTTYYVRAYATNSAGTAYGNELSFTTIPASLPVLTTANISSITLTTATSGGNISSDGGASVSFRGICWSTSPNPSLALSTKTTNGSGTGSYSSNIIGLTASTTYYVRAYATNVVGTAYGNEVSFTTNPANLPVITTSNVTSITNSSAISGGNVSSDGGAMVTSRGICWDTLSNPSIALSTKTTNGTGTGTFISNILGLTANTTYYIRAYATNNTGTTYGSQISFTTSPQSMATLVTTNAYSITSNEATSGGNIGNDGGSPVTSRGVCWSTSPNPSIALNTKTTNGTGTGSFVSNITGLNAGTTYYVRAYATNNIGTSYGNEVSFATSVIPPVIDYDGNIYDTVHIGTQIWMKQNLKTTHYNNGVSITYPGTNNAVWQNNTTGAYAWYNNDEATYKNTYGALYNWYAVNTGNLCPTGWHVPTDPEWSVLVNYLGGSAIAGGKLKATILWGSPNTGATNETGFTALPGGIRELGYFSYLYHSGEWWSSSRYDLDLSLSLSRKMHYFGNIINVGYNSLKDGLSVRCLKDISVQLSLPTITTTIPTAITYHSATSGGMISSDGGAPVNTRGVCWSTTANPTIALSTKTINGTDTGSFTSKIYGLSSNTTYYLRAYATNSIGTAYGNEISFTTTSSPYPDVVDYDGNVYETILIGTQIWMKQNLKTTHYKNGSIIPNVTNNTSWSSLTTGAYCDYQNNPVNSITYGRLYNWHTVNTGNLCPTGWHVPCEAELNTLLNYLGGSGIAGGKLKATILWTSPNTGATNEFGFTALPGGNRYISGNFGELGLNGAWWCSTVLDSLNASDFYIESYYNDVSLSGSYKKYGNSVRCINDSSIQLSLPTITTAPISAITDTNAISGGNISSDGGAPVVVRGVCWSTTVNPTIALNSKTTNGSGTGSFTSNLTGLLPNTTYYLRAYATNSIGTAYGNEISFTTTSTLITSVTDYDGNIYDVVYIGTQIWMKQNLKVTHYKNGSVIPNVSNSTSWNSLTNGAYCDYNNTPANSTTYGRLYNWHTVNTGNLCPTGWHVPNNAEWTTLHTYLGGDTIAGGKLKEAGLSHWNTPNTSATNESNFTALAGGYRHDYGIYDAMGVAGYWWSSTESNLIYSWNTVLHYNSSYTSYFIVDKLDGYSVRCLKD